MLLGVHRCAERQHSTGARAHVRRQRPTDHAIVKTQFWVLYTPVVQIVRKTKNNVDLANYRDNHALIVDDDDRPSPITISSVIEVIQPQESALEVRNLLIHNPWQFHLSWIVSSRRASGAGDGGEKRHGQVGHVPAAL